MSERDAGLRVRLILCTDELTFIAPGTEGTVDFVDCTGTLHITWDTGQRLGLIPGMDRWEELR